MCDRGEHLTFCTCGTDAASPKHRGTLYRQTDEGVRDTYASCHAVGSIALPRLEDEMLLGAILADANRQGAFDVDIAFRDGDLLALDVETPTIRIVRRDGAWTEDAAFGTHASVCVSSGRVERGAAAPEVPFGDARWN